MKDISTKEALLTLLLGSKEHLSGEKISQQMGVSRTAIWKHMNQLKDEGYEIESIRNKGYLLKERAHHPVEEGLKVALKDLSRFESVKVYETIDSTNLEARRLLSDHQMSEGLIVSREQTGGKGRRGRFWYSRKDEGIYMSLVLKPDIEPVYASMLTLIMAMAVSQAIEDYTGLETGIKWPNDIVVGDRKVCGILTEMSADMDLIHHVIIGVGVNVNGESVPEEIENMASSLYLNLGKKMDISSLIEGIIRVFDPLYETFLQEKSLRCMISQYNERCVNINQELKLISTRGETFGRGIAVDDQGALIIENQMGDRQTLVAGEVSVRGLYGYI